MDTFSEVFDRLDRELWLVTARAGERCSGLIATYAARVSLVPELPRVTIALAKHHYTHELIEASGAFCMHLVGEEQIRWIWRFGIQSGRDVENSITRVKKEPDASAVPADTTSRGALAPDSITSGKLSGLATTSGKSGAPILIDAPAWLDCRVEARFDTGDRTIYLAEVLDARIERTSTPLSFKRLLELAPPERLREMKQALERDIELDRAAIVDWRHGQAAPGQL